MPRSPLTVLHLSDIQFGKDHRFAGADIATPDSTYDTLLARLVEDLERLKDEADRPLRPDLVLLTGDLAEWGLKSEFEDAAKFVGGLAEALKLGRDRVVLIPGNHDVNRNLCEGYFATCAGSEEQPQEPFWLKWGPFVAMFRQFYGDIPGVSLTPDQPWSFFEIPALETVVAALNSTMKESHRPEDHYGWVGEKQLRWFAEQLAPFRDRGWWRLAAVHHNVRRGPVRDDENLRDGELLRARLGSLVHAVFHGHTHDGKLDWLSQKVPILATGSAAVTQEARPPEVPNQFQIVRFWPDRFRRWTRRYEPHQLRWVGDASASPDGDSWQTESSVPFDLPGGAARGAGIVFADIRVGRYREGSEPDPHLHQRDDLEKTRQDDLLARVDRICHLREKNQARVERLAAGRPPLEYLRVSAWDDFSQRVYAVGAVSGDVTADQLELFLQRVHQRYREDDPGAHSVLVATGAIPSPLLEEARRQHVELVSFVEFQGLIDLRAYVASQTAELAADPVYPPELFIPQRMQFEEGRGTEETADALDKVWRWLQDPRGRFVLILGDFGTGKTFLLHELARRMGQEDLGFSPILLQMRALEKSRTLDELLSQHFGRRGMDFSPRKFRYMLEHGRVALLVDGFDELAVRVTYPQAAHHFDTLLQAAAGAAKVVVTSRRQHFLTDQEVQTKIETLAGRRIAWLQPFDRGQIQRFLRSFSGDAGTADRRLELLERVEDLMGLSQNPRLLRFIVDLPEAELEEAAARTGKITAAELYRLLLDRWLLNEEERVTLKGAPPNLTRDARWRAVTALALRLWEKTDPSVSLTEIEAEAAQIVQALKETSLDPETAAFQVGSGTLFVRDEEGRFSFLHQSVLEWIVAREAARELAAGHGSKALAHREISRLMAEFFCDLAGRDAAIAWARGALGEGNSEAAQSNARLVLRWLRESIEETRLAARDLRGTNFSGATLDGADLSRANLSGANLQGASLRRANLRAAILQGANLEEASLLRADLSAADLSTARLTRADLRKACVDRAVFRRARLLGARLDEGALAAGDIWGAAVKLPRALEGRSARATFSVQAVAISEDGSLLAGAAGGDTVRLWEAATGREIRRFEIHGGNVFCVAFSPGGKQIASASGEGTVRLWETATGREIRRFEGHRGRVSSVAFAPGGEQLASAARDGTVRLWEAATGREIRHFEGHGKDVFCVAFAPRGEQLASAGGDRTVRLWETATGREIRHFEGHSDWVYCVAFAPDGQQLVSSGGDSTVRLWEAATGCEIRRFEGHSEPVHSVAFAPGGKHLASAADDRTVRLWEVATGREVRRFEGHGDSVLCVAFAADGQHLASAADGTDGTARLWEAATGLEIGRFEEHGGSGLSVVFAPDGDQLASAANDGTVRLRATATGREIRRFEGHGRNVLTVVFAPSGEQLASAAADGTVRLWEAATGREIRRFQGHRGSVMSVAFAPGSEQLASAGADGTVRLWETPTGREVRRFEGHGDWVRSVAFAADDKRLASASDDRTVRLWEVATGREIRRFEGHNGWVRSVAFAPGGERLASAANDSKVRLWEAATGRQIRRFEGHNGNVSSVAFAPGGKQLASAGDDGTVRLWETATGAEIRCLKGHGGSVSCVAFAPEGGQLASAALDGTIRLWEVSSGRCLAILASLPEGWVAFTPDGRYKLGGIPAGGFWHVINLCRFEAGELDDLVPGLRLPDDASFFDLPPWTARLKEAEG